ncbi:hypothetical protein GCM10010837_47400 [Aminobacter niigataensis]
MAKLIGPSIRTIDVRIALPPAKKVDPELRTAEHQAWRRAVLERAGYQCEGTTHGHRCHVRAPARLFADHIKERKDGGALYDVANGQCLCGHHHTLKTVAARADRMKERY